MIQHTKRTVLLSITLLLFMAFATVGLKHYLAQAQQAGVGLEVSPPSQEINVDPGETRLIKAKIRNRSTETLPIEARIEDFTATGDQGQVAITSGSNYSVTGWTTVTPRTFSLAPDEEQEVTATVRVPANAAGGRYGSFIFAIKPDTPEEEGAAALSQQIASLFLVRVSGPVTEKMQILSFDAPFFSEFGPVPLSIRVANKGNVHNKAYGVVTITDMRGKKIADMVIQNTNVFPDAERVITTMLPQNLLLGRFHAVTVIYYGASVQDTLTAETSFIVFPVRIAAVILVVIVLLLLMRKRLRKALKALFG